MCLRATFLVLGLILTTSGQVCALARVIVGNQRLGSNMGIDEKVLEAVNMDERVYLFDHNSSLTCYFKGEPRAINELLRRFVAIPAKERQIILLPAPAKPIMHDKESIPYDCVLFLPAPGGWRGKELESEIHKSRATLTIYIPEPLPPAAKDPQKIKQAVANLASDDFKTRELAAKDLTGSGTPAAALLRESLAGKLTADVRDRLERILAGMNTTTRLDVLELPAATTVIGLDDLLARARRELSNSNPVIRGHAANDLVRYGAPAAEVLPDLEKILKSEKDTSTLAGAARAAYQLGSEGRPILPALRVTGKSADKNLANICGQAIEHIEKAKAESAPEADARRWALIRKEIRAFLKGRDGKADKSLRP